MWQSFNARKIRLFSHLTSSKLNVWDLLTKYNESGTSWCLDPAWAQFFEGETCESCECDHQQDPEEHNHYQPHLWLQNLCAWFQQAPTGTFPSSWSSATRCTPSIQEWRSNASNPRNSLSHGTLPSLFHSTSRAIAFKSVLGTLVSVQINKQVPKTIEIQKPTSVKNQAARSVCQRKSYEDAM